MILGPREAAARTGIPLNKSGTKQDNTVYERETTESSQGPWKQVRAKMSLREVETPSLTWSPNLHHGDVAETPS